MAYHCDRRRVRRARCVQPRRRRPEPAAAGARGERSFRGGERVVRGGERVVRGSWNGASGCASGGRG